MYNVGEKFMNIKYGVVLCVYSFTHHIKEHHILLEACSNIFKVYFMKLFKVLIIRVLCKKSLAYIIKYTL